MSGLEARDGGGETRGNRVYRVLVDQIKAGKLPSGSRLREEDLASSLGVSRTPIREALGRLQARGLAQFCAGGMMVASLSRQQVIELYALRARLEGTAAAFAAENAFVGEMAGLTHLATLLERRIKDPEGPAKLNVLFHEAIYQAAHNRYLHRMLDELNDSLALLPETTYSLPGRVEAAVAEHRIVLNAIIRRDSQGAEAAARAHIEKALLARLELLSAIEAAGSAGDALGADASKIEALLRRASGSFKLPKAGKGRFREDHGALSLKGAGLGVDSQS